jgi:hypothetical protein
VGSADACFVVIRFAMFPGRAAVKQRPISVPVACAPCNARPMECSASAASSTSASNMSATPRLIPGIAVPPHGGAPDGDDRNRVVTGGKLNQTAPY